MHPILFTIGPVRIYTYGFFLAIGFLSGILIAQSEAKRLGEAPDRITDLCFYVLIAAIVGSRLLYVAINPELFLTDPLEILKMWKGGLVFYGGFIVAAIAAVAYVKLQKMSLWKTADMIAPSLAVGQTLGRLGCFFAGCCHGIVCDLPWAVTFRHPDSLAPLNTPLHPTQLYHALGNLFIFGVIWYFRPLKKFDGQLFWVYVLLYGVIRSFLEIFRGDFRGSMFWGALSISQIIGGIMAVVAVIMIVMLNREARR
jgi:phosphatidylglycerol:prolipoprotein diacylglycerol transferase